MSLQPQAINAMFCRTLEALNAPFRAVMAGEVPPRHLPIGGTFPAIPRVRLGYDVSNVW